MLVQPAQLQATLGTPELRVLDTRPAADYAKGHVPGAVRVDVKAWQQLGARDGGLHDAKAWAALVGRLGIGRDSRVVVYGSSLPDAARVWWTLKYLGQADVALLDGGWDAWVKNKLPTDTAAPETKPATFETKFQPDRLEEIDSLKAAVEAGRVTVVDARTAKEFTGEDVRGPRGGHIPGARHLEWKELLAADGRFKTPEQLRDLFRRRGIEPDKIAVTC